MHPINRSAVLERLGHELRESDDTMEVMLLGNPLPSDRKMATFQTPTAPEGGSPKRTVHVALPNVEDISKVISERREQKLAVPKADELVKILDKYLSEEFLGKSAEHVAMLTAWGPKAIADSEGEFCEVGSFDAPIPCSLSGHPSGQYLGFPVWSCPCRWRPGLPGDATLQFCLAGDQGHLPYVAEGFRVLLIVQPRFFPHFREIQLSLSSCGLPDGLVEVLPGITPEADPAVLHEALKHVDRLQFTGSSQMFKSLVLKAIELGNTRMEHAGEVSGLNKVRLNGVSASHRRLPGAPPGQPWQTTGSCAPQRPWWSSTQPWTPWRLWRGPCWRRKLPLRRAGIRRMTAWTSCCGMARRNSWRWRQRRRASGNGGRRLFWPVHRSRRGWGKRFLNMRERERAPKWMLIPNAKWTQLQIALYILFIFGMLNRCSGVPSQFWPIARWSSKPTNLWDIASTHPPLRRHWKAWICWMSVFTCFYPLVI